MARYPAATWRPIGTGGGPLTRYDLLILHTMAGNLWGTDSYFRTSTPNNSHFGIGGKWGHDGTQGLDGAVWQWVDTSRQSAASRVGNARSISVECADNAVRPIEPWTERQQAAIVGLMVWAHRTHGIPLQLAPDSRPTSRGIAFHRLGCDPYRVAGGELWSSAFGKDCPTDVRIAQIPGLIDRARRALDGIQDTPEDDMQADERGWLYDVWRWQQTGNKSSAHTEQMIAQNLGKLLAVADQVSAGETRDDQRTAAVLGAIAALPTGGLTEEQTQAQAAALAAALELRGIPVDTAAIVHALGVALTDEPAA